MAAISPRILALAAALIVAAGTSAGAQSLSEDEREMRARAMATRRAERDESRAERLPSRPVTLRQPVPLPVEPSAPPGGPPAGRSCPADKSCRIDFAVPAGNILVVSALWSAEQIRCDGTDLGRTPSSGAVVAPWWHCETSLSLSGKAAGFAGYLFKKPAKNRVDNE